MPVVSDLRALPRATASERWILGCVLNYEDRRPTIFTRLDESDFFEPSHRIIFATMRDMHRTDGSIGTTLLVERLREPTSGYYGDSPAVYLLELAHEAVNSEELESHVRRMRMATGGRELCLTVNDAARKVLAGDQADEVAGALIQDLSHLQRSHQRLTRLVTAAEIERRDQEWLWSTWLPTGAITIFDGDPGCGKNASRLRPGGPREQRSRDATHPRGRVSPRREFESRRDAAT